MVHAHSGAMGGSASEEFLAISPVGEDTFVYSETGSYAANVEAAHRQASKPIEVAAGPATEVATPGATSIEAVAELLGVDPRKTLKSMVFSVDGAPVIVLVRGDREVLEDRVAAALAPAVVALADEQLFAANAFLVKGYIGPQGMHDHGVRILADLDVVEGSAWVVGGNAVDVHVRDAVVGRDFSIDLIAEVGTVVAGDLDPVDGQPLSVGRGIEMGHIFQLGRKYAAALDLSVAAQDGKPVIVTMGSYGIGVSRAVAAIVEQHHDESGIVWPASVAPYDIHLISVGKNGQLEAAAELADALAAGGKRVLFDDRGISAGVAFKDAELLGMPTTVVVGKALAEGEIEVKDRASGERRMVPLDDALRELAG
jgi:prolyl-tRNA synthetase